MVAVKEPVVVFETKDGGFLFGNYLFFHYDRKSSTPYMSVEMRSGTYPQSLTLALKQSQIDLHILTYAILQI